MLAALQLAVLPEPSGGSTVSMLPLASTITTTDCAFAFRESVTIEGPASIQSATNNATERSSTNAKNNLSDPAALQSRQAKIPVTTATTTPMTINCTNVNGIFAWRDCKAAGSLKL